MPDRKPKDLNVRRIAPRKGRMDEDLFRVRMRSDRRVLDPGWDAHVQWWRGVVGRGREGVPYPTLALSDYRPPQPDVTGRRVQSLVLVPSDTLMDEAVSAAVGHLDRDRRTDLLARGYGDRMPAHGHPFRLEIAVVDPMCRVLISPYGGVCLPISAHDVVRAELDPRALSVTWLSALGIEAPVDPRWVKLPAMTHDLQDGVWRLLCLVDLRDRGLNITAESVGEALVGGNRAFGAVPVTRPALASMLARAGDGTNAAARSTAETLLAYVEGG